MAELAEAKPPGCWLEKTSYAIMLEHDGHVVDPHDLRELCEEKLAPAVKAVPGAIAARLGIATITSRDKPAKDRCEPPGDLG